MDHPIQLPSLSVMNQGHSAYGRRSLRWNPGALIRPRERFIATLMLGLGLLGLSGCGSNGDAVTVQGDFPVVFAMRASSITSNPTTSVGFAAGGDLMMINLSSPSAPMKNLTYNYTQGKGDVSDPEVSYDGSRILFAMRGPNDAHWGIYEITVATQALRKVTIEEDGKPAGDDVDPAYLPDGRIVYVSNRQETSQQQMTTAGTTVYQYLDEYDREPATLLSVMNADGTNAHQISANQSHDRNPTVLMNGEIMFSRWDHLGTRNHFPIFTVNPDGTDLFIDYGAFSPGNSFLHPREMPNGQVMSDLMPLSGTHEGGALMGIDILNFSENDQPISSNITGNGQRQLTLYDVNFETREGVAQYGRYTTPYPLWDGTNRALVSWTPSRPVTVTDPLTGVQSLNEGTPQYGVYMFDLNKQTLLPVALPPDGWSYVDPIAVAPRPVPNVIPDKVLDQNLAAQGLGVINIKSVYDTDVLDVMGLSVLAPTEVIPETTAPAGDLRTSVADIMTIKDPSKTTADQRPARFLRVGKAVPTPMGLTRQAIGETDFEMQQLLGYTVIQPDGSARILVPANTPIALSVVDAHGLAFQRHTDWLQVKPGETRTCNGCHSPRRGVALNLAPIAGNNPNTTSALTAEPGESMAETFTRINPATPAGSTVSFPAALLQTDMNFTDVWDTDEYKSAAGNEDINITYNLLKFPSPVNGVINFEDHIAPIFTLDRATNTCTVCHNNADPESAASDGLDLRADISGTGRMESYEALTLGPILYDPTTGLPEIEEVDGAMKVMRGPALIPATGSTGTSRTGTFFATMTGAPLATKTTPPMAPINHQYMLNPSELRIIAEWADQGVQYFNSPFDSSGKIRSVCALDQTVFNNQVFPILMNQCASCHQPLNTNGTTSSTATQPMEANQFVLTGDPKGDYDVTLTMVTNVSIPQQNPLLTWPTSKGTTLLPHPQIGTPPAPVLSTTDASYQTIYNWIASGQTQGSCSQ